MYAGAAALQKHAHALANCRHALAPSPCWMALSEPCKALCSQHGGCSLPLASWQMQSVMFTITTWQDMLFTLRALALLWCLQCQIYSCSQSSPSHQSSLEGDGPSESSITSHRGCLPRQVLGVSGLGRQCSGQCQCQAVCGLQMCLLWQTPS